uniref:Uncharacterized protein n=1 Tax=Mucochytrium quahogii TaxID=96639 RepID=A0A7S2W5W7_9STRA
MDNVILAILPEYQQVLDILQKRAHWSWEEFLTLIRDHATDITYKDLYALTLEANGESILQKACSKSRKERRDRNLVKEADQYISQAMDERLDAANHDEWHVSLLEIYKAKSQLHQVLAEEEQVTSNERITLAVDRYLGSRSGKTAAETIVKQILDTNNKKKKNSKGGRVVVKRVTREEAELAAFAMIRKKKTSELTRPDFLLMVKEHRASSIRCAEKSKDLTEQIYGFMNPETTLAYYRLADLFIHLDNFEEACDHLTTVMQSVSRLQGNRSTVASRVAKMAANVHVKLGNEKHAATSFEMAAECADAHKNCKLAVKLWQEACAWFGKADSHGEQVLEQWECAAARVVDLFEELEPLSNNLVNACREYGLVLLKVGDTKRAKDAFRQAKSILIKQSPNLTPDKRKEVCRLNRLMSSASTSSELKNIMKESNEEEEGDLANASWLM